MAETILRLPQVLRITGMGRTWTYEAIRKGEFPAPLALGARAVGWRRSDIDAWLASRRETASCLHAEAEGRAIASERCA